MKPLSINGLLIIFLISCSSPVSKNEVYHLDPKSWPTQTIVLDKIIKEIRVIPLETKPECLISYISEIQFTSDMILTLDGETLRMNCFDPDGKFLRTFGTRGKGPGEYSTAAGMLVNQEKSEVLLNRSPTHRVKAQKIILREEVPGFIAAEKVTRDGNPVLVLYKFREF